MHLGKCLQHNMKRNMLISTSDLKTRVKGTKAILQSVSEQIKKCLLGWYCANVNTDLMSSILFTYPFCWDKHQKLSLKES